MNICEGCIKQDVCKFKGEVEKLELLNLPEPLKPIVECKYKRTEYWTYTSPCVWIDPAWPTTTWDVITTTSTDYILTS